MSEKDCSPRLGMSEKRLGKRLRVFINIPRSHFGMWEDLTFKKVQATGKRKYRYSVASALKAEKVQKEEFLRKLKEFRVKSLSYAGCTRGVYIHSVFVVVYMRCRRGVHGVYPGCT